SGKRVLPTKDKRQAAKSMAPKERIRWSDSECEAVVGECMKQWRRSPLDGLSVALVVKAMHKTIDQTRWRNILGWSAIKPLRQMLEAEVRKILESHDHPV